MYITHRTRNEASPGQHTDLIDIRDRELSSIILWTGQKAYVGDTMQSKSKLPTRHLTNNATM